MNFGFIDIIVSVVLAMVMFGIGLSLKFSSFRYVFVKPRALLVGLSTQIFALPVLAFSICLLIDIDPVLKVGLMILSVCPGGSTSNLVSFLMNGNTALSISLTTVNSFLILFSIPYVINLSLNFFLGVDRELHLPYFETIFQIFVTTILPAALGVFINTKMKKTSAFINTGIKLPFGLFNKYRFSLLKSFTIASLAVVFGIILFAKEDAGGAGLTRSDFILLLPVCLLFHFLSLLLGYFVAKSSKVNHKNAATIGIEVGLQNTTLAFLVAGTILQSPEMQKPALVYAFFSFWTTVVFAAITLRKSIFSSSE